MKKNSVKKYYHCEPSRGEAIAFLRLFRSKWLLAMTALLVNLLFSSAGFAQSNENEKIQLLSNLLRDAKQELLLANQSIERLTKINSQKELEQVVMQKKIMELKKNVDEPAGALNKVSRERNDLQRQLEQLLARAKELESQNNFQEEQNQALNRRYELLQDEYAKASKDLTDTLVRSRHQDRQKDDTDKRLEQAVEQLRQLRQELIQSENLSRKQQEDISGLKKDLKQSGQELEKLRARKYKETEAFDSQVSQFKSLREAETANLKSKISDLQKELQSLRDSQVKVPGLFSQIEALKANNQNLEQQNGVLDEQLKADEEKLAVLRQGNEKAGIESGAYLAKIRQLEDSLEEIKAKNEAQKQAFENKLNDGQKQLEQARLALNKNERSRDLLESDLSRVKREKQLLEVQAKDLEEKKQSLEKQSLMFNDGLKTNEEKLASLKIANEKSAIEAETYFVKLKQLEESGNSVQQKIARMQVVLDNSEQSRAALESEITRLKKEKQELVASVALNQKIISDLKSEKESQVKDSQVKMQSLEKQNMALNDTLKADEEKLAALKSANEKAAKEKENIEKQNQSLNDALKTNEEKLTVKFSRENQSLAVKTKDLESQNIKLSQQVSQFLLASQDADKEKQTFSNKLRDSQSKIEQLNLSLGQSEQSRNLLQAELAQLKNEKDGINTDLVLARRNSEQLKFQRESQARILNDKNAQLEKDFQNSYAAMNKLAQEKSSLEKNNNQLAVQLRDSQEQWAIRKQQNDKLDQQNTFLKNEYVASSEKLSELKKYVKGLEKERDGLRLSIEAGEKKSVQQEAAQQVLLDKAQNYEKQAQKYQEELKNKNELDGQNKLLVKKLSELKDNYEKLGKRSKDVLNQNKLFKSKYGKLPRENTTLHYNLGVVYTQKRDFQKAIVEFQKVLEYSPEDAESNYNLGVIYGEYLNDRQKALKYFKKFLTLSPSDADAERVKKYIISWETFEQQ